jgi:hypothetical protein
LEIVTVLTGFAMVTGLVTTTGSGLTEAAATVPARATDENTDRNSIDAAIFFRI